MSEFYEIKDDEGTVLEVLGTPVDGVISRDSQAVMALQRRLNDGRI